MHIDHDKCRLAWRAYLDTLPPTHPHRTAQPDTFGFGGEPELAEELALLVIAGRKRATTSLPSEYQALGESLPQPGDVSIVVRGDGTPAVIIEFTEVTTLPFDQVTAEMAAIEGEGDGSLTHWRHAHQDYFAQVCTRLGGTFHDKTPVLFQTFRILWSPPG